MHKRYACSVRRHNSEQTQQARAILKAAAGAQLTPEQINTSYKRRASVMKSRCSSCINVSRSLGLCELSTLRVYMSSSALKSMRFPARMSACTCGLNPNMPNSLARVEARRALMRFASATSDKPPRALPCKGLSQVDFWCGL